MAHLDDSFLTDVGLESLPAEEKKAFLAHVQEELKLRIGEVITEGLDEERLAEFEQLPADADQDAAKQWFEKNYPAYKSVVNDQVDKLKREISDNREQILGVS